MAPNTNIGAASVVGGGGEDLPETLARKVTNDAVARIRSLARRSRPQRGLGGVGRPRGGQHRRGEAVTHGPAGRRLHRRPTDRRLFAEIDSGRARRRPPLHVQRRAAARQLSGLPISDVEMNLGQQFLHLL